MTIDTTVLLIGIAVWGLVNVMSIRSANKYLGCMMRLMEKITDACIKTMEKITND